MHNIQSMFESATLKLTGWYLLIIMLISISFSILVYNFALGELSARLGVIGTRIEERDDIFTQFNYKSMQEHQYEEAAKNFLTLLIYSNLIILAGASFGSYLWARNTLRPIEEAHEAQSRFTSDASHELRTPLSIIKAETEVILRDKSASKQELREVLQSNLEEVTRLSDLSTLLLRLAQLEVVNDDWESTNLHSVAAEAISAFPKNQQTLITLQANKAGPVTQAHPESIKEAVAILIENALKYSTPTDKILIRTFKERGRFCISVKNRGAGIPEKDINKIFDRFYQSSASRSKKDTPGYGLGLSLAKKIIELHHGEITVKSKLNDTTTFTIRIP